MANNSNSYDDGLNEPTELLNMVEDHQRFLARNRFMMQQRQQQQHGAPAPPSQSNNNRMSMGYSKNRTRAILPLSPLVTNTFSRESHQLTSTNSASRIGSPFGSSTPAVSSGNQGLFASRFDKNSRESMFARGGAFTSDRSAFVSSGGGGIGSRFHGDRGGAGEGGMMFGGEDRMLSDDQDPVSMSLTSIYSSNEPQQQQDRERERRDGNEEAENIAAMAQQQQTRKRTFPSDLSASTSSAEMEQTVRKLRDKDAELIAAKAVIGSLESRVTGLESASKKARVTADTSYEGFRIEKDSNEKKIERLERELEAARRGEAQKRAECYDLQQALDSAKTDARREKLQLEKQLLHSDNHNKERELEWRHREIELEQELSEEQMNHRLTQEELQDVQQQREMQQEQVQQQRVTNQENIEKLTQALAQQRKLESELERYREKDNFVRPSIDRIAQCIEIERENASLREEVKRVRAMCENNYLLNEEIDSLRSRLGRNDDYQRQLVETQHRADALDRQLTMWRDMARECMAAAVPSSSSSEHDVDSEGGGGGQSTNQPPGPESIIAELNRLQQIELVKSNEIGELRNQLSAAQRQLHTAEKLSASADELNVEKQVLTMQVQKLTRKLRLVTTEKDSIQSVLSSYEQEMTLNLNDVQQQRIATLEQLLQSYKDLNEQLEQQIVTLQKSSNAPATASTSIAKDEIPAAASLPGTSSAKDNGGLDEKVAALERRVLQLTDERDELQAKLDHLSSQGAYDPASTRIMQLMGNPLQTANEEVKRKLEALTKENEALKARVDLLQKGETEDITGRIGSQANIPSTKQLQELEQKLSRSEQKSKRLMEMFQKTSQDYRNTVYTLTGYRIDAIQQNRYKLSHAYAESPSDYLLFELNSDGHMKLLETPYSTTLSELISLHLQTQNSIPVFLGSITVDLFSRQTFTTGSSDSYITVLQD